MADPVLQWASLAQDAERATGVPTSVLLGLVRIESGGIEGRTSSAGAGGLTQFMPGTAPGYGVDVRPGHARSQIMGAARYLIALGYKRDPALALAKYNGGPGNPQPSYARSVLAAAASYTRFDGGHHALTDPPPAPSSASSSASSSGGLLTDGQASGLARFALAAVLIVAALALVWLGAAQSLGLRRRAREAS